MMTNLLSIDGLTVIRGGRTVLHQIDLTVGAGELVALLGPNGAGKSTLALSAASVLPASAGAIAVDGKRIDNTTPDRVRRAGLAMVPEGHRVLGQLTVTENLEVAASSYSRAAARNAIDSALELFPELSVRLDVESSALSGGQKQMVALAQAIIAKPKCLIVDELSLGLSPAVTRRLLGTLQHMTTQGVAVVLVEQFTSLALSVANRAYVLSMGRIAFEGAAKSLQDQPEILHQAYLASHNEHPGAGNPAQQPEQAHI